jgi:hypothetical protein
MHFPNVGDAILVAILAAAFVLSQPADGAEQNGKPAATSGVEYRASDGSFTCRIPSGWRAHGTNLGGTIVQVLEPENGGEDRILISALPSGATSLQELAQQAVAMVTQQLLPGYRASGIPRFSQQGDAQIAENRYEGMTGAGQATWWHGFMLKNGFALGVLGGARSERAQAIEEQCRAILASMRLNEAQNAGPAPQQPGGGSLAAALVGRWTYYSRSDNTRGSVSKQIVFYANGRFEYTASTYMPNMPSDIDPTTRLAGSYQIVGNTLIGRGDNGQQATYTLELIPGGGLKINGELFIRE